MTRQEAINILTGSGSLSTSWNELFEAIKIAVAEMKEKQREEENESV